MARVVVIHILDSFTGPLGGFWGFLGYQKEKRRQLKFYSSGYWQGERKNWCLDQINLILMSVATGQPLIPFSSIFAWCVYEAC